MTENKDLLSITPPRQCRGPSIFVHPRPCTERQDTVLRTETVIKFRKIPTVLFVKETEGLPTHVEYNQKQTKDIFMKNNVLGQKPNENKFVSNTLQCFVTWG